MDHRLSKDQFDALAEVQAARKGAKPSACVARNAKHLTGIKLLKHLRGGEYVLTEQGAEALFVNSCIKGLRAVSAGGDAKLDAAVANFLGRKGYVAPGATPGTFEITAKGRECLVDIDQNPPG